MLAGEFEQLVGGNRRYGLLEVAHGLKPSSIKPGLAEPRDGVILGVGYGARCRKALALRAEFALLADVITGVVKVHCFPAMLVRGYASISQAASFDNGAHAAASAVDAVVGVQRSCSASV